MCYFCASVSYDFYIGQQFEQTTNISIAFSRTGLQKNCLMKTFGLRIIEVRIIKVRIIEDVLYSYNRVRILLILKPSERRAEGFANDRNQWRQCLYFYQDGYKNILLARKNCLCSHKPVCVQINPYAHFT